MTYPVKVLILEDDPKLRLTLTASLEDIGYTLFPAADGLKRLEILKKHRPDSILTDLRRPKKVLVSL